jgi:hypothetical protein
VLSLAAADRGVTLNSPGTAAVLAKRRLAKPAEQARWGLRKAKASWDSGGPRGLTPDWPQMRELVEGEKEYVAKLEQLDTRFAQPLLEIGRGTTIKVRRLPRRVLTDRRGQRTGSQVLRMAAVFGGTRPSGALEDLVRSPSVSACLRDVQSLLVVHKALAHDLAAKFEESEVSSRVCWWAGGGQG